MTNNNEMQFASTINKKYLPGAKVFLKSLITHNKNLNNTYNMLMFDDLNAEDKCCLTNVYKNTNFISIQNTDYNYYNTSDEFRTWGFNCFNRFDIFTIKAKKLIFFDLDMVINQPLDYIFNINVDFASVLVNEKNRIDHPTKEFFDGGLMIISEKYLNKKTKDKLIEISKTKKWSSDEPVLNLFFENKVYFLPKSFNVLSYEFFEHKNDYHILQYVGANKPWMGNTIEECFDPHIIKNNTIVDLKKMLRIFKNYEY